MTKDQNRDPSEYVKREFEEEEEKRQSCFVKKGDNCGSFICFSKPNF